MSRVPPLSIPLLLAFTIGFDLGWLGDICCLRITPIFYLRLHIDCVGGWGAHTHMWTEVQTFKTFSRVIHHLEWVMTKTTAQILYTCANIFVFPNTA